MPRVAFLPDTYHEVNGVALTSRQLESFARRRQIPFLSIHSGPSTETIDDGAVRICQLARSWARVPLDAHLDYDLLFMRYAGRVTGEVKRFGAELIHITGPGDLGMLGCYVAWRLKLPLVISWHTSFHEYAGRRLERMLWFVGSRISRRLGTWIEQISFQILKCFYRKAAVTLAPNPELVKMLCEMTGRPVFLMLRGIETDLFSPNRRNRRSSAFQIGYVGRLTPEKNVRFLATIARGLTAAGHRHLEFVIVGQGSEAEWLRQNVPNARLRGVLHGIELAEAYANFDLFVFPSTTDTFGNVVLEALASGIPAIVTSSGGPKFLVQDGLTGYAAARNEDFIAHCARLISDPETLRQMRQNARHYALSYSWDRVLETVIEAYSVAVGKNPVALAQ